MEKQDIFNKYTGKFESEAAQSYENASGFKGNVYSRTTPDGRNFYASAAAFGSTFKNFRSADNFMRKRD